MNSSKSLFSLWAPFAIASMITLLLYATAWAMPRYWIVLSFLAISSAIFAVRILARTGVRPWPVVWIVLGLIVGQWWIIELISMELLWRIRGFAP